MKSLTKIIKRYMYRVTAFFIVIMFFVVLIVQLAAEQKHAYETSLQSFELIRNKLEENEEEIRRIQEEYAQTSLYNAELVADIVSYYPEIINDVEGMRKLAVKLEIDEIHIFDESGHIFTGTHPEYYGYTFDTGEQIMFFKPMLSDKALKLVQKITPNTAEGKMMQYSAVWSDNGKYIVQIGVEPDSVSKLTEKNEISYIFSKYQVDNEVDFYDIDAESGIILGSTDADCIGQNIKDCGIDLQYMKTHPRGFYARPDKHWAFCVFLEFGDVYIGRVVTLRSLYQTIPVYMLMLSVCMICIFLLLSYAVTKYIKKYVVDEIHSINDQLNQIANGRYNNNIRAHSSMEFFEIGNHINEMLKSILAHNKKMSYVLRKTNLLIGVYEYNRNAGGVSYTDCVPKILSVKPDEMEYIASDTVRFKCYLEALRKNAMPDDPTVFKVKEKYIRLDEIRDGADVFGVAVDVTPEIMKRKQLQMERDIDMLTGLFNRRGFNARLTDLFVHPKQLGYYALIVIDTDGLKEVNDIYGHECGDIYLRKMAEVILAYGTKEKIASRYGGDEFAVFLYDYNGKEELETELKALKDASGHTGVNINETQSVMLRFSFGCCLKSDVTDYREMFREADEKMYEEKRRHHEMTAQRQ